jgi:putative membrane protein
VFINYITLMLINMVAALFLLAGYVYWGLDSRNQKQWIAGFGIAGAIALITGLHMIFTWPVPGSFNIIFGEMSVLFGILFVGASLALAVGWELLSIAIYAFFAGAAAILIGLRIINLGLTRTPFLSGIGFILSGLGGVFAAPTLYLQRNRNLRLIGAIVLVAAALIWAYTGYLAYWNHLADYSNWKPLPMRSPLAVPFGQSAMPQRGAQSP